VLKTGQIVPESGVYRVHHAEHRLAHEVTLLAGQQFPRCAKCADAVEFEPIELAPLLTGRSGQIVLYELPVIGDSESDAQHGRSF
jgi:hypothetical protein